MKRTSLLLCLEVIHIELAALKTLGDLLKESGWTSALVQAGVTTAGTADSFLKAAHITRTRRAHQELAPYTKSWKRHTRNTLILWNQAPRSRV